MAIRDFAYRCCSIALSVHEFGEVVCPVIDALIVAEFIDRIAFDAVPADWKLTTDGNLSTTGQPGTATEEVKLELLEQFVRQAAATLPVPSP
jgi:hypothetical protein